MLNTYSYSYSSSDDDMAKDLNPDPAGEYNDARCPGAYIPTFIFDRPVKVEEHKNRKNRNDDVGIRIGCNNPLASEMP